MKFLKTIAVAVLCVVAMTSHAFPSGTYTNKFVRNGTTYVQRGQLTPADYVVTNVDINIDTSSFMSKTGGVFTGDVEISQGHFLKSSVVKESIVVDSLVQDSNLARPSVVFDPDSSYTGLKFISSQTGLNFGTLGLGILSDIARPTWKDGFYGYAEKYLAFKDEVDGTFLDWKTNMSQVALGNSSQVTAAKGIAIGVPNASGSRTGAAGNSSVAIGIHATTSSSASQGVAIGANASASAVGAVQIGEGDNSQSNSLKFRDVTIVNSQGKIPLSIHDSSVVAAVSTVDAWQNYWGGDDVRVTVTNYYGTMAIPSLYIEQKMAADDDHDDSWFKVVWDERTRWNQFLPSYSAMTNDIAENKADRAWGVYDSSSGEYSPDGLLQLSQEQIMIASGMAYQKTVTAGGCAIWVLKSTSPTTVSGVTSNGFFRIEDGDGNALFEIVKGDKRVVGATATDMIAEVDGVKITYNCVSDDVPSLEWCSDLSAGEWSSVTVSSRPGAASLMPVPRPGTPSVAWTGSSGAWLATVTFSIDAPSSAFFKATFEAGGNTYIKNNVATSIDKVVIGGIEYNVTVETINGKKLMVLNP